MTPFSEIASVRRYVAVAAVLLVASAVPIYYQLRELYLGREAYARYQLDPIRKPEFSFYDHRVVWANAAIHVDGRRYTLPRAHYSSVALVKIRDVAAERDARLALIGRAGGSHKSTWTYDVLFFTRSGDVVSERFTFGERGERLYRTILARFVSPEGIGFESEVLQFWPTILYPLLYPWLSAFVAVVLLLLSVRKRPGAGA